MHLYHQLIGTEQLIELILCNNIITGSIFTYQELTISQNPPKKPGPDGPDGPQPGGPPGPGPPGPILSNDFFLLRICEFLEREKGKRYIRSLSSVEIYRAAHEINLAWKHMCIYIIHLFTFSQLIFQLILT